MTTLNLTDGSRHGDYPDAPSPETPARGRAGVYGCARRVHVVDHAHVSRQWVARHDASSDVPPPLVEREAALPRERAAPHERIQERDAPERRELPCERPRRNIAAFAGALGIARDRNQALGRRWRDRLDDESRSRVRQPASSSFLPAANERPRVRVVDDGRTRLDEREPAAHALGAASDRPRPRRATSLADGRHESRERAAALRTQRSARTLAADAALRQEEVQRPHGSTVRPNPSRLRVRSVPRRAREDRPRRARDPRAS